MIQKCRGLLLSFVMGKVPLVFDIFPAHVRLVNDSLSNINLIHSFQVMKDSFLALCVKKGNDYVPPEKGSTSTVFHFAHIDQNALFTPLT